MRRVDELATHYDGISCLLATSNFGNTITRAWQSGMYFIDYTPNVAVIGNHYAYKLKRLFSVKYIHTETVVIHRDMKPLVTLSSSGFISRFFFSDNRFISVVKLG